MDLGGIALFFWIGLALGSSSRYSFGLLYSIQAYYKIINKQTPTLLSLSSLSFSPYPLPSFATKRPLYIAIV